MGRWLRQALVQGLLAAWVVACGDEFPLEPAPPGVGGPDVSDVHIGWDAAPPDDAAWPETAADTAAADVAVVAALGGQCQACETDADCLAEFSCRVLLNGSFCSRRCTGALDCSTQYTCVAAAGESGATFCTPPNYACEGCLATGCPDPLRCDAASGKCVVGKGACAPCSKVSDCAVGLACTALASPGFATNLMCMPECSAGNACPAGSLCQKTAAGNTCGFTSLACCYGACKANPACSQCPDACILGQCVGCLLDSACPGGHCDTTSHTCVNGVGCPADKPVLLGDGTCGQCAGNADCSGGLVCDIGDHICLESPASCSDCTGDLPDCVPLKGKAKCVMCTADAACAAKKWGTCDLKSFTCSAVLPP